MSQNFDRRPETRASRPESAVFQIRRPATVFALPGPLARPTGRPLGCEALATMALDHALANEHLLARRAADEALATIETLASHRDQRGAVARSAHTLGEAFLALHEALRARHSFELAIRIFDIESDMSRAADARVGLAKALLALRDPSARAVLEDAGDIFEDIGDEKAALAIDFALRQAEADFEESPRSFHARSATHLRATGG